MVIQIIFLLNFVSIFIFGRDIYECMTSCNHHENNIAFETCLKICSRGEHQQPFMIANDEIKLNQKSLVFLFI